VVFVNDGCDSPSQGCGQVMGNSGIASTAHLHVSFQTTTDIVWYTVGSSYEYGSRDPEDLYGRVKVQRCA
jgi:hypothetical protein